MRGLEAKSGNEYDCCIGTDQADGELIAIPLWRTALAGRFEDLAPRQGERVAIEYLGRQESRSGKSYHAYKVLCWDRDGNRVFHRTEEEAALRFITPGPPMPEAVGVGVTPTRSVTSQAPRSSFAEQMAKERAEDEEAF